VGVISIVIFTIDMDMLFSMSIGAPSLKYVQTGGASTGLGVDIRNTDDMRTIIIIREVFIYPLLMSNSLFGIINLVLENE